MGLPFYEKKPSWSQFDPSKPNPKVKFEIQSDVTNYWCSNQVEVWGRPTCTRLDGDIHPLHVDSCQLTSQEHVSIDTTIPYT